MPTIEHFAIYAADAPGLKEFYRSAFGLSVLVESGGDPPGFFLGDDRGTALEVIGRPAGQSGVHQRWVCHIAFWVDDFGAACARLQERGIVFETDTLVENEAIRTAFFNDPEGNRCQIVWRKHRLGA
jgi:glyoxylase I family protein